MIAHDLIDLSHPRRLHLLGIGGSGMQRMGRRPGGFGERDGGARRQRIEPEDLERVFDRFRKGSTSTGSGLGLTISRNLVEAHGGTVVAARAAGGGTLIAVELPKAAPPESQPT